MRDLILESLFHSNYLKLEKNGFLSGIENKQKTTSDFPPKGLFISPQGVGELHRACANPTSKLSYPDVILFQILEADNCYLKWKNQLKLVDWCDKYYRYIKINDGCYFSRWQ